MSAKLEICISQSCCATRVDDASPGQFHVGRQHYDSYDDRAWGQSSHSACSLHSGARPIESLENTAGTQEKYCRLVACCVFMGFFRACPCSWACAPAGLARLRQTSSHRGDQQLHHHMRCSVESEFLLLGSEFCKRLMGGMAFSHVASGALGPELDRASRAPPAVTSSFTTA